MEFQAADGENHEHLLQSVTFQFGVFLLNVHVLPEGSDR